MLPTMRTGRGYYHISAKRREPGPSQLRMCEFVVLDPGSRRGGRPEQGDAGMSGYGQPGHPLSNSLHML